jgi:hypothetical protein
VKDRLQAGQVSKIIADFLNNVEQQEWYIGVSIRPTLDLRDSTSRLYGGRLRKATTRDWVEKDQITSLPKRWKGYINTNTIE